jgi:hypothetical protein
MQYGILESGIMFGEKVAVELLEFCSLWETSGWTVLCVQEHCGEETGYVSS